MNSTKESQLEILSELLEDRWEIGWNCACNGQIKETKHLLQFGPGWYQLLIDLITDLNKVIPDFTVMQIKEKFAALEFYYSPNYSGDNPKALDIARDLVRKYSSLSRDTCEECGSSGILCRRRSWRRTMCKECFDVWTEGEESNSVYDFKYGLS